jgi:hypothetical protein
LHALQHDASQGELGDVTLTRIEIEHAGGI